MPLLVDTYNVLHVVGVLPPDLAGVDTAGLARLIAASRFANDAPRLVCDGTPKPDTPLSVGPVRIQFAGPGVKADDLIAALVERSSAPKKLTVVSNDRQIRTHASRRKCRVLSSETFLAHLAHDHANPLHRDDHIAPPAASVEAWIDEFNLTDELSLEPTAPPPPPAAPPSPPFEPKQPPDQPPLDELNMDDLIDEDGNWRGPDS